MKYEVMLTKDADKTSGPLSQSDAIVEFLSRGNVYPERPKTVECIETHISWVFLTDRHAYKLKKPVKYDFLDFSTADLREQACREELRLNRRLAPDVYLDVVPITSERSGRLGFGGNRTAVDWVVKMRRLPADCALDEQIRTGRSRASDIEQLASVLASFYQQLPPLTVRIDDYLQQIETHIQANRRELLDTAHHLSPALIQRFHSAQLRVLRLVPELLENRVRDGRIVEGHGDLRPEHIYFDSQPTIIDCLEFNRELRCLDVLDELALLAMECDLLGDELVGSQVIDHYRRTSGDRPPAVLLAFYKLYRACVRDKVLSLRARQIAPIDKPSMLRLAEQYLHLAERYCDALGPPLLLVVRGLPGSGKSTLATSLAESLAIEVLQTDRIRRDLFGQSALPAAFGEKHYGPEANARVYEEMLTRAGKLLDGRQSVILDGTFLSAELRRRAVSLAQQHEAEALFVRCQCPDEVAMGRISDRMEAGKSLSETRPEFFEMQRQLDEPDPPDLRVCPLDTTNSLPELQESVFSHLRLILMPLANIAS